MSRVERSALVPRPQARMFELVNDIEAYPRRLSWCVGAQVVEQGPDFMLARLTMALGGMNVTFTTRNLLEVPERLRISLVEGPFRRLEGVWEFKPLGPDGCRISLMLDFEVAGKLVGGALALGFHRIADHLVDEFVRAALASA